LNSPVYRWPGGNFVSGYDWRDGIGDRDKRPPRKNPAWTGVEHNDFGLDEFMLFCKELKTEPYIAVNTGNGEVDNAFAELQYTNGSTETEMGKLRAKNGHAEPYHVKFWGIGNEMYGDWQIGHMPVEQYAEKNNRFVDAFRKFDPKLTLIAVGNIGKWDDVIMRKCADHMDMISEHFYIFEPNDDVIRHVQTIPHSVKLFADVHRKYRTDFPELKGKDIRIALDEWNYWYGEQVFGEVGTRYFMKDGLGIAAGLHEFFRNSDIFYMANYAQTVNVIGCIKTNKTNAQFETTGLALKLYRNQFGVIPVQATGVRPLEVSAALTADQKTLTLGIVNPTDKAEVLSLETSGIKLGRAAQKFEIANDDPMAHNDPGAKQKIDIQESPLTIDSGKITVAPMSITLLRIPSDVEQ
jgi:alpha-N-arabinofuranosidase